MRHRIVLIDSALLFNEQLMLGAHKCQYFQALDHLAAEHELSFLDHETKNDLYETTQGLFFDPDNMQTGLQLAPEINMAFGVDEFSQISINNAASWINSGMELPEASISFMVGLNSLANERSHILDQDEEDAYDVTMAMLVDEPVDEVYNSLTSRYNATGFTYISREATAMFPDDRDAPPEKTMQDILALTHAGAGMSDVYYITANKFRQERAKQAGLQKTLLVSGAPYQDQKPEESFAHLAVEVRAFLYEQEEGGLLPVSDSADDAPEYVMPTYLN